MNLLVFVYACHGKDSCDCAMYFYCKIERNVSKEERNTDKYEQEKEEKEEEVSNQKIAPHKYLDSHKYI